jgi:phosphoribosylanthranilate isomerase
MAYLRVKICGVKNEADAVKAAELGADAIGLNFYNGSPRYIPPAKAESIVRVLPPFVDPVSIFVDESVDDLQVILKLGLRTIQTHSPDEGFFSGYPFFVLGVRWIPAFSVSKKKHLEKISDFLKKLQRRGGDFPAEDAANLATWLKKPRERPPDFPAAILLDGRAPGKIGGTGKTAPWELLADYKPGVPLILAGGLTPEKVAEAVRIVRPYAVDVASGVESSPGHKDPDKMKRFIENAREAAEK